MGAFKPTDISKHSFKYMHNLIDDIKATKPIKLMDGSNVKMNANGAKFKQFVKSVSIQNESDAKRLLQSGEAIVAIEGELGYTLSDIDKLPYSKAGGSGAGSVITKLSESAVCIALASLVHLGKFNLDEDLMVAKISSVLDLGTTDTKKEIKLVLDWLKTDETWLDSIIKTAKAIKSNLSLSTRHHFHRDSTFMNSIYKEFHKNLKPLNKLGLRVSGDKWNPSDIWITNKSKLSSFHDLTSLNNYLLSSFCDDDIMGVSLKKVGKSVTFKVYNLPKQKRMFRFKSLKKPPKPLSAKDANVETQGGMTMQVRSFGAGQNVQCELKGANANGGKCGHGALKHIVESLTTTKITPNATIKRMDDDRILSEIAKYHSLCFSSVNKATLQKEFDAKNFSNDSSRLDFLISKLQALQIASAIKNDKQSNDIVTAIYGYAHSMGLAEMFEASVYAKVY